MKERCSYLYNAVARCARLASRDGRCHVHAIEPRPSTMGDQFRHEMRGSGFGSGFRRANRIDTARREAERS